MQKITSLMADWDADCVGVCPFPQVLPLLPVRSAGRVPHGAASVMVALFPYYVEAPGRNLARYAVLPDYHRVAGDMLGQAARRLEALYPGEAFLPFVDASPLREVEAAQLAGLGRRGQNGQIIHPRYGSYVLIGAIVTTLALVPSDPLEGGCRGCGRCIAACPTGALSPTSPFRAERCRSHITQKKGELSPWEQRQVRAGGLAWGCDLCTDACPHNHSPLPTPLSAFRDHVQPVLTRDNLAQIHRESPCGYRSKGVLERNLGLIGGPANQHM